MKVILGTSFYDADPDTMRRQTRAMDALRSLPETVAVDLQWRDTPSRRPWLRTLPALRRDSTSVTGCAGRVKPIACDVFDVLAETAKAEGARYFLFFNSDIVITPDAIRLLAAGQYQVYAFSRMDQDATGGNAGVLLTGFDAFAFDAAWWRANRRRFRPYILGEPCWDNVYTALAMCHANATIVNREAVITHELHLTGGGAGAFAAYNGMLASLDARYFTLWARYHHRLLEARKAEASERDERAMAASVFVWRPSAALALKQAARDVRAHLRYRRERRRWPMV